MKYLLPEGTYLFTPIDLERYTSSYSGFWRAYQNAAFGIKGQAIASRSTPIYCRRIVVVKVTVKFAANYFDTQPLLNLGRVPPSRL